MSELSTPQVPEPHVAHLPRPLPERVKVKRGMTMTPNEMRTLREKTGKSLTELLGGEAEDMDQAPDRIQSLVWIELRRQGYECEWEDAGDVIPDMEDEVPDPTPTERSATSQPSATSGE